MYLSLMVMTPLNLLKAFIGRQVIFPSPDWYFPHKEASLGKPMQVSIPHQTECATKEHYTEDPPPRRYTQPENIKLKCLSFSLLLEFYWNEETHQHTHYKIHVI